MEYCFPTVHIKNKIILKLTVMLSKDWSSQKDTLLPDVIMSVSPQKIVFNKYPNTQCVTRCCRITQTDFILLMMILKVNILTKLLTV